MGAPLTTATAGGVMHCWCIAVLDVKNSRITQSSIMPIITARPSQSVCRRLIVTRQSLGQHGSQSAGSNPHTTNASVGPLPSTSGQSPVVKYSCRTAGADGRLTVHAAMDGTCLLGSWPHRPSLRQFIQRTELFGRKNQRAFFLMNTSTAH